MTSAPRAETKTSALLAISRREASAKRRHPGRGGNQQVALSTAGNSGAAFSIRTTLVQRSSSDDDPRHLVAPEIPAAFAEIVPMPRKPQAKPATDPVTPASSELSDRHLTKSKRKRGVRSYAAAHHVQSLHDSGSLGEMQLAEFAHSGKFDETALALSMMCNLPIGAIERAFVDDRSEQILVLAKAIGLSWQTAKALLLLRVGTKNGSTRNFDLHFETFVRLKMETAKTAIQFYRLRARAATPRSN